MKLLAPSILSADFWRLGEQIQERIEGGAEIIHFGTGKGLGLCQSLSATFDI